MRDASPQTIYLKDYRPPDYLIERTDLYFDLHDDFAFVTSELHLKRNAQGEGDQQFCNKRLYTAVAVRICTHKFKC